MIQSFRIRALARLLLMLVSLIGESAHSQNITQLQSGEPSSPQQDGTPDDQIQQLLNRVETLEQRLRTLETQTSSPESPAGSQEFRQFQPDADLTEDERVAQAALERMLINRGGLLIPTNVLEVEPSFTYIHSSADTIRINGFTILPVLVIGDIVSQRVRTDTMIPTLTFRYGLPWNFQLETRVPYVYTNQLVVSADGQANSRSFGGIGDVEVALSHQLFQEQGWRPGLLGSMRWKSTTGDDPFGQNTAAQPISIFPQQATGSGFHSLFWNLTAIKINDPVVFFGGPSFLYNFADTKSSSRIRPGHSIGFQAGLAIALNLDTSINFALDQRFISESSVNGRSVNGSSLTVGIFRMGASYVLAPGFSLDTSVGIGLTRDAPDLQFTIAIPVRFPR